MTRCKFWCTRIDHKHTGGDNIYCEITLNPVYSSDPESENKWFAKATPSGNITLGITNPSAIGTFELGKSYYVDFTPAE
jgi:hypothetical protein